MRKPRTSATQGERLYMKGLMEMQSDRNFYPDANFTMRLTYGTVEPYKAADAVNYNYYTTMDGVMAKYVPGNWEFDIPQDVRDLVAKKDYGRYANENGELSSTSSPPTTSRVATRAVPSSTARATSSVWPSTATGRP
jgi:Peptidase S46.